MGYRAALRREGTEALHYDRKREGTEALHYDRKREGTEALHYDRWSTRLRRLERDVMRA